MTLLPLPFLPPVRALSYFNGRVRVMEGTYNELVLCSLSTGDFCDKELNPSSCISIGNVKERPLAYVDDLADINRLNSDIIISGKNAFHFQHLKRLKHDSIKYKIIPVSCHKPTPVVYVNGNKIEEVNEFGYHGDPLSHKENNDGLFKRRITKVYGKIIAINAVCKEVCMRQYELDILLELCENIVASPLLFKCQSWTNLTASSDIKSFHQIRMNCLKQMMKVPHSTPNVGLYLELPILQIETEIDKRQMTFLDHIVTSNNQDPVRQI